SSRLGGNAAGAGGIDRSGDCHHHRAQPARCALDPRCQLSAPRSGTWRECDSEARKRNKNSQLSAQLVCDVLRKRKQSPAKTMAGGLGFEPRLTESESAVLPLNYPPIGKTLSLSVVPGRVLSPRSLSLGRRGARTSTRRQHI